MLRRILLSRSCSRPASRVRNRHLHVSIINGGSQGVRSARGVLATLSATPPIHAKRAFSSLPQPKDPTTTEDTTPATSAKASSVPAVVEYTPIDFAVKSKIEGSESHIVTIELQPGECVRAESGSMVFMTDSIVMNATLGAGASSAFQRMMTGQNVFLTDFTCDIKPGTLCLGTDFPSKILRLNLQDLPLETLICQRGAYLASNPTVNIEMEFTKSLSAGFFGGQGFILQKLTGTGDVLIKGGGTIVVKDLRDGEKMRVSSGSIVAFERTVDYDIQMMPGIKNAMFGGEGLFVTSLTGPGRVWLQGMPPDRMIAEIARRVPSGPGLGFGIPILGGGGGGEGGGAAEGAAGESAEVAGTGAEAARLSDAAVAADRQATVASSGMESSSGTAVDDSSPSALFGDAAPTDVTPATAAAGSTAPDDPFGSDDGFASSSSNSSYEEPTFDDTSVSSDEFTPDGSDFADGELFDDTTSASEGASEAAGDEGGSSIFQTLWDMFMGDDDD